VVPGGRSPCCRGNDRLTGGDGLGYQRTGEQEPEPRGERSALHRLPHNRRARRLVAGLLRLEPAGANRAEYFPGTAPLRFPRWLVDLLRLGGAVRCHPVRRLRDGHPGAQADVDVVSCSRRRLHGPDVFRADLLAAGHHTHARLRLRPVRARCLHNARQRAGHRQAQGPLVFDSAGRMAARGLSRLGRLPTLYRLRMALRLPPRSHTDPYRSCRPGLHQGVRSFPPCSGGQGSP
jgi:hypothetical protein